ncbi:MAG: tRNA (adenosine(37)-N6)-threonylcarbamoyltransferase complex ATPase subunit type 1 TsaE [Clostridia bacterium]|nr:tRNA (adenosine(37)-N6)-threonylcarbamoyltransferase complex ATPase subunit type 1 TsaE [Clostridia bacterium]
MVEYTINNINQSSSHALGLKLSELLFNGGFIAMFGDLGAGKTTLTKAVASGFGIDEIASPTFTVVREHTTTNGKCFFHFDAYRLCDEDELSAIGFDDYISRAHDGIIIMEWSENVLGLLPANRLDIAIFGNGDMPRRMIIKAYGEYYENIVKELEKCSF